MNIHELFIIFIKSFISFRRGMDQGVVEKISLFDCQDGRQPLCIVMRHKTMCADGDVNVTIHQISSDRCLELSSAFNRSFAKVGPRESTLGSQQAQLYTHDSIHQKNVNRLPVFSCSLGSPALT